MQPIRPRRFSAQRTLLRSGERTRLHVQGQVAVRLTLPLTRGGTLGAEWQCHSHCHSMVSVRGSASHTATHTGRYARGRVAVPLTLPLDGERTGQCVSHCHSTSSVPRRYVQGQVAVWVRVTFGPTGAAPMPRHASSERAQTLPKTVLPRAAGGLLAEESLGRSD